MNETEINNIRQSVDIVDIISEYIPLIQKGKNYFAVCPFHDDHKPSMVVSKEKQIFNCFTCHTGGNVFAFIMKYENVSFLEAVKILATKSGINITFGDTINNKNNKYKKEYEIMDLSNKYFINILNTQNGLDAKKYLFARGITEEIIKDFKIGLANKENDALYNFFKKQNYNDEIIEHVGLLNKSGINYYDVFSDRIMIPITNNNGQIVGYTGRIFHNEDLAKYINTKETEIFKKSEIIFNYYNAKKYIRESNNIIIVEGNMDAIKMYASGIKNVVALMGVALSKYHIEMLKKLRVPIILMLDNDSAGLEATIKNGDYMISCGLETLVVRLNDYKDPDEFIRSCGVDKLKEKIKNAISYIDFKINYLKMKTNFDNTNSVVNFINEIKKMMSSLDETTKSVIINRLEKENIIDVNSLHQEDNSRKKDNRVEEYSLINEKVVNKATKYKTLANKLLFYMMDDAKYIEIFINEIGYFEDKIDRDLMQEIKNYHKNGNKCIADLITYLENNQELLTYMKTIVNNNFDESIDYNNYSEYIKSFKQVQNKMEINKLKEKIKETLDVEEKIKLMNKLTELKKDV